MGLEQERKYFTFQVQIQRGAQKTAALIQREWGYETAARKVAAGLQRSLNCCGFFICRTKGWPRLRESI